MAEKMRAEQAETGRVETGEAAQPQTDGAGRDAKGRFAAGNLFGPGNPYNRRIAELRQEMLSEVTGDALKRIIQALIAKAEKGDTAAARLVFQYVLGTPMTPVHPDHLELDEWNLRKARPTMAEVTETLATRKPLECPNIFGQGMDYAHIEKTRQIYKEDLARTEARRARQAERKLRREQRRQQRAEERARRKAERAAAGGDGGAAAGAKPQATVAEPGRAEANGVNGRQADGKPGRTEANGVNGRRGTEANGVNGHGRKPGAGGKGKASGRNRVGRR